jgi:hypothetical protein
MKQFSWRRASFAMFGVILLAACSDPAGPTYSPVVTNATDDFQLQATGVTGATLETVYTWQNTGTAATVTHATLAGNGFARLLIFDGAGTLVYDANLQPTGSTATAVGVAGSWTIELILTGFGGTLNFRVQKL